MLRIGICDDQLEMRQGLLAMLQRLLDHKDMEASFFEFSSGEGTLRWLEKHPAELDVLFLDIEMGGINGMEAARRARALDARLMLVFVTGFGDYVFDGYEVGALDYLIKPVDVGRLERVLVRILGGLELQAPDTFALASTEGMFRVPKSEILYFQSEGRRVHLVTAARRYTFYDKLDATEREVGDGFVRIHQRYLVRCSAVDSFEGSKVRVGDEELPVSRACRPAAMMAIAGSLLGGEEGR